MIHPEPETQGDTSPEMLGKLAKIGSDQLCAFVDVGPSIPYYTEFYHELARRQRAAIDAMDANF